MQSPKDALRELFRRMAFSSLLDIDSPACRVLFLWNGRHVDLAPVHSFPFPLNPEWSFGWKSARRWSRQRVQIKEVLDRASPFGLDTIEATSIVDDLIHQLSRHALNVRVKAWAWETPRGSSLENLAASRHIQPGEIVSRPVQATHGGSCSHTSERG